MKNFFKKFQNYSFWVSLSAGIILLLNSLGRAFGFKIENKVVEDFIMSIAGVLVILGIVSKPDRNEKNHEAINEEENEEENKNENMNK